MIGVVDLLRGRAVHGRAGRRESYAPVRAAAGRLLHDGDAASLARTYVDVLGVRELYVADLDAIGGGAPQATLTTQLAATAAALWLDAGVATVSQARDALAQGASRVVVGLETLVAFDALAEICSAVGGERVAFSLDLRDGQPIALAGTRVGGQSAETIASRAADAGVGSLIVLDLARVGTGAGVDAGLLTRVRTAAPAITLLAGGGVRGWADIEQLAAAGCDGALVATALHDGRLGPAEVEAARRLGVEDQSPDRR